MVTARRHRWPETEGREQETCNWATSGRRDIPLREGFQLNPQLPPTVHVGSRSVTFLPTSGEHGTLLCL